MSINEREPLEPIIRWLFFMVVFLVFAMIGITKWSPNDGQTFQVLSTTLAGFSGALIMRINPPSSHKKETSSPASAGGVSDPASLGHPEGGVK